jgi:hypothetical protein
MNRRTLLQTLGAATTVGIAGCSGDPETTPVDSTANATATTEAATNGGAARFDHLHDGGFVLALAHPETKPAVADTDVEFDTCRTQPMLTEAGREQAQRVGTALRALGIPVDTVETSRYCRARDTARLVFGAADVNDDLTVPPGEDAAARADAVTAALTTAPGDGTNTALVASADLFATAEVDLQPGETGVVDPSGDSVDLVEVIDLDGWTEYVDGSDDRTQTVTTYTIRKGTEQATDVHVLDAPAEGPTFFLVGGVHGDEVSGWKTATAVTEWEIDAGTLVVLPKANVQAVEREIRTYPEGMDLNRQFERGEPPKTQLAHDIWYTIVRHDPDVLVDLHSSKGFQADDSGYVGQNVFHSQQGTMGPDAEGATTYLNENHVPESRKPTYAFVTTTMSKNLAMIADKVRSDLDIPTAIFEVTEADLPEETRVEWTTAYTRWMLDHWGVKTMESKETTATETEATATSTN